MSKKWNPRYLAYCQTFGKTPDEMLAFDEQKWPGGIMCGFILWHSQQVLKAREVRPEFFFMGQLTDHEGYDRWLKKEVAN